MEVEEMLARTTFAAGLRPDQLQVLNGRAEVRQVGAGESILGRNDTSFPLMVLLEGEGEVRGMFDQRVSVLKTGALVGEIAWLDRGPRTADVVATTDATVALFPEDLISWLNLEHPDITAQVLYNLSRVLCGKLRWAQRLIDAGDATSAGAQF